MASEPPPLPSSHPGKKNPRYPSKTCKYAGVTFRASRDKYQARIYKGNKEYNLGLFDLSADAALAYDVAHRLVKKISSAHGKEKATLELYEADKNALDWLDYGEDANANSGLDPDKLNFLRPLDFKVEREKELNASQMAGSQKHENCPKLEELRLLVRKESIRVTKIIIGASDGGTNNYRRKSKKKKEGVLKDGSLGNPSKKKRKKATESNVSSSALEAELAELSTGSTLQALQEGSVASAWAARDDAYYQATGLGRPVPNPSLSRMKEHPFGPPPVVPMGAMARNNPGLMSHLDESTLKAMMEAPNKAASAPFHDNDDLENHKVSNGGQNHESNGMGKGAGAEDNHASGGEDNNSNFSQDTMQAGNISQKKTAPGDYNNYMGMPPYYGMSGERNAGPPTAANHGMAGEDFNPSQSPENYREFFKNMRNMYTPGMGAPGPAMGPNNMYAHGASPEDFQRMMFARAMGQNAAMHHGHAAMGSSMMGMENPSSSWNQANLYSDNLTDPKKAETKREMDDLKSMSAMQGGLDRPTPSDVYQGQYANQNLRSLPPTTLSMLRQGAFSSSQGHQSQLEAAAAARDQLQCYEASMYNADRYSQHLRGALGPQYGLDPSRIDPSRLDPSRLDPSRLDPSSYGQFGAGRGEGGPSHGDQQSLLQSFGQSGYPTSSQPYGNSSSNGSGPPAGGGGPGYPPALNDMAHLLGMSGSSHPSRNQGKDETHGV